MSVTHLIAFTLLSAAEADAPPELQPEPPQFSIDVPAIVLTDVPVDRIVIAARTLEGERDASYSGRPLIRGIRLTEHGTEAALPPFTAGTLVLTSDLEQGRKVYVTADEIVVDPDSRRRGVQKVPRVWRWFALLPPVLAIVLAVWVRSIYVALFVGIWCGSTLLMRGNLLSGFLRALETFVLGQLVGDESHGMIVLFTLFLGATVGVMSGSGGTAALVHRLARWTSRREHGQFLTWALGLVVFFDDYANTLLVGSTMRPATDRLRISREKLAFLVDSTAAPVAGLAIVSTWVGVEVGYIQSTFSQLGVEAEGYTVFLATLPYRFYALHLLVFVLFVAILGHDYGPMLRAETRAASTGQVHHPDAQISSADVHGAPAGRGKRELLRCALVPIAVLLAAIVVGLWWTGSEGLADSNRLHRQAGEPEIPVSVWSILEHARSNQVLLVSSFLASIVATLLAVASRSLSLSKATDAWLSGAKSMFVAVVVLVLAWGLATVCDAAHLNTAGFLVEVAAGRLSVQWMPTLAFVLAAGVSFATGSSWSTMGLLLPLFISTTYYLLAGLNEADPRHPLMLGAIGGVLAGSIFGDHCSPISDTTVLSSAATGCDHLDHVTTQLPYALTVAGVSLLLGYLPAGFGYSPLILLPLGVAVLFVVVQFVGKPATELAPRPAAAAEFAAPLDLSGLDDDDDDDLVINPDALTGDE